MIKWMNNFSLCCLLTRGQDMRSVAPSPLTYTTSSSSLVDMSWAWFFRFWPSGHWPESRNSCARSSLKKCCRVMHSSVTTSHKHMDDFLKYQQYNKQWSHMLLFCKYQKVDHWFQWWLNGWRIVTTVRQAYSIKTEQVCFAPVSSSL